MNVYLYARKSTDDEERQILSIEAQLAELREYAAKEGIHIVREFIESRTAKEPGRPIFNAMLDEVEKGEVRGLLAWHPDRLARNSVDGGRIIYLVDTGKLTALKFPTFWFEDTPQGKFFLNMAFGQSKYYVDALSENVRRGMRQKLRRGEFPGKPPVGYLNEPRLRTIIVDEPKARLVRRMFEAYASGRYTFDDLHELVTGWGLTSHREQPIARSMLPKLLANPFYVGLFQYSGETHEGSHQPIVSRELFEQAQNVLASRGRPHKPRRRPLSYLGFIQCGDCGASVTGERQKGHHYYRCTRKLGPCTQKRFIREETLTDQLRAVTASAAIPSEPGAWMLSQVDQWRQDKLDSRAAQLADARTMLAQAEVRLSRLLDVYLDGSIEQADYARKKDELLREKSGIKERIRRIEQEGSAWLEPMAAFLKDAILLENTALSGTEEDLRNFHRRIGSNLSLIEPQGESGQARTSKERAEPSSSRHGGHAFGLVNLAARDALHLRQGSGGQVRPDSDCPRPPMRKAGSLAADDSAAQSQIASPAVTSNACQAESMAADVSAASGKSVSRVAESHDSATPEIAVKKSSSRWADRPVPVLQVEFPEPWSIVAAADIADATGAKCAGKMKWSGRRDLNSRPLEPHSSALPVCATPRSMNV